MGMRKQVTSELIQGNILNLESSSQHCVFHGQKRKKEYELSQGGFNQRHQVGCFEGRER